MIVCHYFYDSDRYKLTSLPDEEGKWKIIMADRTNLTVVKQGYAK